jgi:hypothetical protein
MLFQRDRPTIGGHSIRLNLRFGRAAILKCNHLPDFDHRERRERRHGDT